MKSDDIDDSQSSAGYFKRVFLLAERLARTGITVYEHKFDYMAFGSWEIVAGRRKKMLRFNYDGKDAYLSWCDAAVRPKTHTELEHRIFKTHEGEEPLTCVAEILEKEFSSWQK
ncbi:MAG TPA: hypothetical protein VF773_16135 [Verrucomicrobiae bacterium]